MSGEAQRRLILHMSVSLDGFSAAGRETPAPWITASRRASPVIARSPSTGSPSTRGGGSALILGLPKPQSVELVSSTVQVLRPTPARRDG